MRSMFKPLPGAILARFDSAESLMRAAEKMKEAGYKKWDTHSPFPIHGMDAAMGLKRSPLGYVVGVCGTLGLVGMLALTWYASMDYPLVISGKPYFSWIAYVPVLFAITVLMSAFGAFFGMLALNQLPQLYNPLFHSAQFEKVGVDGFFISVTSDDPAYDEGRLIGFLESIGGRDVENVRNDETQ